MHYVGFKMTFIHKYLTCFTQQIEANLMNNFQIEKISAIRKESTGMATSCMILT